MSPKPNLFGVRSAVNLAQSMEVATGISQKNSALVSDTYKTVLPNLSAVGGIATSGTQLKAVLELSGAYAIDLCAADKPRLMSDPAKIFLSDLNVGFTVNGRDTFTEPAERAISLNVRKKLRGVDPTENELKEMVSALDDLHDGAADTAAGKLRVCQLFIALVLATDYWY